MRHPRPLLSLSLLIPALAACPGDPGDTDGGTTTETGTAADTDSDTTAPTTGEPSAPQLPTDRFFLRIDDTPPPPVVLEMDKAKALEIFGEAAAKDITLIELDSGPLLDNVLATIQNSCGDQWNVYDDTVKNGDLPVSPNHDCNLTALGKLYDGDPIANDPNKWRTSPQFAMVRLLTMTPRNAVVATTVMEDFQYLFSLYDNETVNGLTFSDVLAASLFCGDHELGSVQCTEKLKDSKLDKVHEGDLHTRPFIPVAVLRDALKVTLLASHPNIANSEGKLPVTLYDALMDMRPLSDKLGPVGDHPGLLVPDDADFTTYSDALTPEFKMVATADSNLRRVDGIDASEGAGEMFLSLADAPLAFDFNDPVKVVIEGIAANPTVDMRMAIAELDTKVPSCVDGNATCAPNLPDSPLGDTYVWSQPEWSLERIIAQAAYLAFKDLDYPFYCFAPGLPCLAGASVGMVDPGWAEFDIQVPNLVSPAPQYLWEMLLDVAQDIIHDPAGNDAFMRDMNGKIVGAEQNTADNLEEGGARPVFALKGVPIGFTADEMIAQIRPTLQSQADKIADVILGNYWTSNGRLDFYYRRAADGGTPYLFFVGLNDKRPAADDPTQLADYTYTKPGFFADPELKDKVSSTTIDGVADTEHEKYRLPEGESTLYIQDDVGDTYELRFTVPAGADPVEIVVRVRKL
ncbi:hypothetical protein SAMN02745121_00666 [Nannocystis exedens]|uniref:Lipoprotein n=1 Tax=Nannocystis exedens TaxID=54 RepID=A0A1I1TF09_9BACT|nr:hypothetical protein [Nannocystis exedens]PCC66604.1 hypothetical protein NAEX_09193 [Nannocystis exedens]SFD57172.1 hypothetical protein SAMN02745121_00666 [Nannocystis exedens]